MNSRRYVICDIEATGLDEEKEIIEIALITYQDGKVTDVFGTLINPLRSLSSFIQDLTSISPRELQEAPKFYDVAEVIKSRLEGAVFVSHNTDFDFQLLKKKYMEMGEDLKLKTFCTLKVAQREIPGLKSYSLDALCHFFGIKIQERHRAIGDANATLELFKELFQLRLKTYPRVLHLPHHENQLKKIPSRSGLVMFKDDTGKVVRLLAAQNMEKEAREGLVVVNEHRDILIKTQTLTWEITGSPIIAQFKKLLFEPYRPNWLIALELKESGEKNFRIRPFNRGLEGPWYFQDYLDARDKLKELKAKLTSQNYAWREGEKSKEEILKHNQKVDSLVKEARFPAENLIILGEGRTMGEKSLVLVRNGNVLGYGYSESTEEEILKCPEAHLTRRFFRHLGADLVTKRYLRELKNMRRKSDIWRSLAEL